MVCSNCSNLFSSDIFLFQKSSDRPFSNVLRYFCEYCIRTKGHSYPLVGMDVCTFGCDNVSAVLKHGTSWWKLMAQRGTEVCLFSVVSFCLYPPLFPSLILVLSALATAAAVVSWSAILYVCSVCLQVVIINVIYLLFVEHVCLTLITSYSGLSNNPELWHLSSMVVIQ